MYLADHDTHQDSTSWIRHALLAGIIGIAVLRSSSFGQSARDPQDFDSGPLARWREQSQAARRAYSKQDYAAYREDLLRLLRIAPGFPDVMYRLAGAEARLGRPQAALEWLEKFAATGLTRDMRADSDLTSLRGSLAFAQLAERSAQNSEPVSHADTTVTLPDSSLLAEDIAYDATRRTFYVSSVRERKIVAVDAAGRMTDFTHDGQDGVASIFALARDPNRHVLWATTSATPIAREYMAADSGRSALLEYDLRTGHLLHRYDPPDGLPRHALGDMTVASNGDVYVSDGRAGIVYVLRRDHNRLEQLAGPDVFASPQTPAITPDGRHLLVADYLRGIASVDIATGHTKWLTHPDSVAVNGIDGMYLVGNALIAVQNGTMPERVIRLDLDATSPRILSWAAIESNSAGLGDPTHGVVVGSTFYFLGNSGWDRFNADGTLRPNVRATAPTIRSVPLIRIRSASSRKG